MSAGKIRVGIVGVGWWAAANHLPILKARPDVELVGVCRLGKDELAKVQQTFDIPYGTESYEELLETVPMDAMMTSIDNRVDSREGIRDEAEATGSWARNGRSWSVERDRRPATR